MAFFQCGTERLEKGGRKHTRLVSWLQQGLQFARMLQVRYVSTYQLGVDGDKMHPAKGIRLRLKLSKTEAEGTRERSRGEEVKGKVGEASRGKEKRKRKKKARKVHEKKGWTLTLTDPQFDHTLGSYRFIWSHHTSREMGAFLKHRTERRYNGDQHERDRYLGTTYSRCGYSSHDN